MTAPKRPGLTILSGAGAAPVCEGDVCWIPETDAVERSDVENEESAPSQG